MDPTTSQNTSFQRLAAPTPQPATPFKVTQTHLPQFDPKLMDPTTKLKASLEFQKLAGRGLSGKVIITHFKDDPVPDRLFAIKKPIKSFAEIIGAATSKTRNQVALSSYQHNIVVAKALGGHPNFMNVHGVIVKDKNQGESKPYLLLEYIDGTILRELRQITDEQKAQLLDQVDKAFSHLLENNIFPGDLNFGNIIITPNYELKLIDYDDWKIPSNMSPEVLKQKLDEKAAKIKERLDGI
jgi:serine/threonine protein kinase